MNSHSDHGHDDNTTNIAVELLHYYFHFLVLLFESSNEQVCKKISILVSVIYILYNLSRHFSQNRKSGTHQVIAVNP